jgi:bacteriorhodopsin
VSNFTKFVANEVLNLSVGYLAGLTASTLVSKFFVKKGLVNLWGLAAKREAVSKDNYEWLLFGASYLIGLAVMLVVSYLMKRIRKTEEA